MDGELVRRKKMGGKAGKKKWKKQSDTTLLQLKDLKDAKKSIAEAARPKSSGPMFKIQIEPDIAIKKKLDKDRFKEMVYTPTSRAEEKAMKKLQKSMKKLDGESTEVESRQSKSAPKPKVTTKKVDDDIEAGFDLWKTDLKDLNIHHDKPQFKTRKELEIPKTLTPYAGQSYNPSHQDQLELMKEVVRRGEEKYQSFKSKSDKAQERTIKEALTKRPPQKPRTKKEKELYDAHEKQRELKKKEYDSKNIERYFNEAKNKQRKHGNINLCQKEN